MKLDKRDVPLRYNKKENNTRVENTSYSEMSLHRTIIWYYLFGMVVRCKGGVCLSLWSAGRTRFPDVRPQLARPMRKTMHSTLKLRGTMWWRMTTMAPTSTTITTSPLAPAGDRRPPPRPAAIWIFGGAVRIRTSSTNSYSMRRRVWLGYPEPIKVIWY